MFDFICLCILISSLPNILNNFYLCNQFIINQDLLLSNAACAA